MSALAEAIPGARRGARRVHRRLIWWSVPVGLFAVAAVAGPIVVPYDAVTVHLADRLAPPGAVLSNGTRAWLGTDQVGKDLLAQVLQGARISLQVGVATIVVAGLIGLIIGVAAGSQGKWFDALVMRLADLQLAFPSILLAILIAAVLGRSVANVIITLSVTRWVTYARIARASTLMIKEREFITAAQATGVGGFRLVYRHIVPFTLTPLVVVATVELGLVMLAEASLSFLGLGTTPASPSWGLVIANGRDYLTNGWWISTIPGVVLSLVVVSVGQFGDAVRDALDPRAGAA
ncbi:MAG: ABC transporter permease [Armatimonadota bacterium]|nr:ABC transporter permease [Armatimonadota bacterium]